MHKRRKLDRSRPFGTCSPPYHNAIYDQDGVLFDCHGREIFTHADDTPEKIEASIKNWESLDALAAKGREAKTAKKPEPVEPTQVEPTPDPEPEQAEDDGAVNLAAWAKGEAKYGWWDVRRAISERFHREVTNKVDAIDTLIEKGVVSADDVEA